MIVIGAGSYGTVPIITLTRSGYEAAFWGHDPGHIATLERDRYSAAFLLDMSFPDTLHLESDPVTMLAANRNILVVVPSYVFGEVLRQTRPLMCPDTCLVWATGGLGAETGRLLQDVTRGALGDQIPLVVISGLTSAKGLAIGLSTAISLASTDQTFADDLQQLLHCGKGFRVYSNPNFISVQFGGAMKNVIAIGVGISGGIGFGANARTALIIRGLVEVLCFGMALGADPATPMSMAGPGDPALTRADNQSRNCRFSIVLGQGMDVQSTQERIGQMVEGYRNAKEVCEPAHRFGVGMPITKEIYQVLYCGKNAREVVLTLLGRARRDERSNH